MLKRLFDKRLNRLHTRIMCAMQRGVMILALLLICLIMPDADAQAPVSTDVSVGSDSMATHAVNSSMGITGCTGGIQYPVYSLLPTPYWQTVTNLFAGEYSVFDVVAGETYIWSLCAADGGHAPYNSQLSLRHHQQLHLLAYDDDFCGDDARITWTAIFTGQVRVLVNQYDCQSNQVFTTLAYRDNSIPSHAIVTASNPATGGYTTGDGTFYDGSTQTVTAVADTDYVFVYWTENNSIVSYDSAYTFFLTGNRHLVAHFVHVNSLCVVCPLYNYTITPDTVWQTHTSLIDPGGCKVYRIAVPSQPGYTYSFQTGCGQGASADFNTHLMLYDDQCALLAENVDACGSQQSALLWVSSSTTTGFIYLKVSGYDGSDHGSYTLAYSVTEPCIPPSQPSPVWGSTTPCEGDAQTYVISSVAGATSYTWSYSGGGTVAGSDTMVTFTPTGSGILSVVAENACGTSTPQTLAINLQSPPVQPAPITGDTLPCEGIAQTYSIPPVAGATSYTWSYTGGGLLSGNNTEVTFTPTGSGILTVEAENACGTSTPQTISIHPQLPPAQPSPIAGNTAPCQGSTQTYTIPPVAGATDYNWSYTGGGTVTGNDTTVTFALLGSGTLIVVAGNACGTSAPQGTSVIVQLPPDQPEPIAGNTLPCLGMAETYSIPTVAGATSYTWSYSGGGTVTGSDTAVTFTPTGSGTLTVEAENICGTSAPQTITLTLTPLPDPAPAIAGPTSACHGDTGVVYSVTAIPHATSYIWTTPSGSTGNSTTETLVLAFDATATQGDITVRGVNICGEGAPDTLNITVNPIPNTPTITLQGSVLLSDAPQGNQWYDQNGPIPGAIDQQFTIPQNGHYYTIVTLNQCSSEPSNTLSITIGIESAQEKPETAVYPNPFDDQLHITLQGNGDIIRFELVNTLGQVIHSGFITEKYTLQTGSMSPGIYHLRLTDGTTVWHHKVIRK